MIRLSASGLILFFLFLAGAGCDKPAPALVCQVAVPAALPAGAPGYSDVCFSSRWEHPANEQDTLDTFRAAHSFFATHLNWVYTTNPDFIRKATSAGFKFQVALSPTLEDLPFGSQKRDKGRIRTPEGNPATAPWMKNWNAWWGCANHPDFRATYMAHIRAALDAGAIGFQVDDPGMASTLVRNQWEAVCHCEYCRHKADSLGLTVEEIQDSSVIAFHRDMKKEASRYAGRPVPFSCNNFRGEWELFPFDLFDFGIAEIPERRANPEYLFAIIRETRRRGKAQVFSFVSDKTWLIQKMIATTYAAGGNLLVPWDVWQGNGRPRFFGKPEDFAPFYGFIRANARYFEGYEDAFYTSTQIDPRYQDLDEQPMQFTSYRMNTHAFIRARPGKPEAPVVIHLVDWEVLMNGFSMMLNEDRFFRNGIHTVELLQPAADEINENAGTDVPGDSATFVSRQPLDLKKEGSKVYLEIPKLNMHWGLLIVQ